MYFASARFLPAQIALCKMNDSSVGFCTNSQHNIMYKLSKMRHNNLLSFEVAIKSVDKVRHGLQVSSVSQSSREGNRCDGKPAH